MILYALFNAIFLFLITGQAFQMQAELNRSRTIVYLMNFVSDVGFNLALRYVFGVSLISLFLACVSRTYKPRSASGTIYHFTPGRGFYVALFSFLLVVSAVLIFVVVGVSEFLHSSRPGYQTGSTIFIVLLVLGIVPVLLKIICRDRLVRGDIACLLLTFMVSGAFSRIHVILYLTAILLAYFYSYGWADRPLSAALVTKLLMFGSIAGVVFFGIGALHDAQNFVQGSFVDLINYVLANPDKSILSIEYNYRVGVEGMSGIAGAFTQSLSNPYSVRPDYGISSLLGGLVITLPGFLKASASGLLEWANDLNWYPYSIVATGAETFFVSFGWSAVLLYPLATYFLGWHLPSRILAARVSALTALMIYLLFGCSIFFVRGTIATWIGFSTSYAVVIFASWPFFSRGVRAAHVD